MQKTRACQNASMVLYRALYKARNKRILANGGQIALLIIHDVIFQRDSKA